MKLTSFDISKKLAEIGFKPEVKNCSHFCFIQDPKVFGYDLETILEALPKEIPSNTRYSNFLRIDFESREIAYYSDCAISYFSDGNTEMAGPFIADSLVDTAALLLILLHEKGIINFKSE